MMMKNLPPFSFVGLRVKSGIIDSILFFFKRATTTQQKRERRTAWHLWHLCDDDDDDDWCLTLPRAATVGVWTANIRSSKSLEASKRMSTVRRFRIISSFSFRLLLLSLLVLLWTTLSKTF